MRASARGGAWRGAARRGNPPRVRRRFGSRILIRTIIGTSRTGTGRGNETSLDWDRPARLSPEYIPRIASRIYRAVASACNFAESNFNVTRIIGYGQYARGEIAQFQAFKFN